MFAIPELQVLGRIHNFMNNIQYEHFASLSIYIYRVEPDIEARPTIWQKTFKMNTFK